MHRDDHDDSKVSVRDRGSHGCDEDVLAGDEDGG